MDPLDREKPWNAAERIAVITLVIGLVFLVFRFAVVIPDWGWKLITAITLVGVGLYYFLAFKSGGRKVVALVRNRTNREILLGALLIVALMVPVGLALYFVLLAGSR